MTRYFLILFLLSNTLLAQNYSFEWVAAHNNPVQALSTCLGIIDNKNNIITVGTFTDSLDLDIGQSNYWVTGQSRSIYISKHSANKNFLWGGVLHGVSGQDRRVYSAKVDQWGNIYLCGDFRGGIDFDMSNASDIGYSQSPLYHSGYIAKYDKNGQLLWYHIYKGSDVVSLLNLSTNSMGEVVLVGRFFQDVDLAPDSATQNIVSVTNRSHGFITKLDSNGVVLFAHKSGSEIHQLATDSNGDLYASGIYYDTTDFPGTNNSNITKTVSGKGIFIGKLNSSGEFNWIKTIDASTTIQAENMTIDQQGSIYLTGSFRDSIDVDPGSPQQIFDGSSYHNRYSSFIVKLNSSGNYQWAKQFGGRNYPRGLQIDNQQNVIVSGSFLESLFLPSSGSNTPIYSKGHYDNYLLQYDNSGQQLSISYYGDSLMDNISNISMNSQGDLFSFGTFRGTVDFDLDTGVFHLTSIGYNSPFIMKMTGSTVGLTKIDGKTNALLSVFPNPALDEITVSLKKSVERIEIYDVNGAFVRKYLCSGTEKTLNIQDLKSGVYYLNVFYNPERFETAKFIKL